MAKTSTHTYTQGVVCVFVSLTMCMYSGWEGHAEGSIVTIGQHGGNIYSTPLSGPWFCLDFGGGDSQANQSTGGIPASCVVQDFVDEV